MNYTIERIPMLDKPYYLQATKIAFNDAESANLFLAAPDMYEALKAWDNYATKNYPENMKLKRIAWDLTELALAKAEGR
jgi:hypothetical protein